MTQVKTFDSEKNMNEWLAQQGNAIKVVNVSTTKRGWSASTGFFGSGKTIYTVTYETQTPVAKP